MSREWAASARMAEQYNGTDAVDDAARSIAQEHRFSGLRGGTGRFSPSSTEGRLLLASTASGAGRPRPSIFSSTSSSASRADLSRSSCSWGKGLPTSALAAACCW